MLDPIPLPCDSSLLWQVARDFCGKFPELKLVADYSHW